MVRSRVANLVVTPCTHCGAPLEFESGLANVVRCAFCGTTNDIANAVPAPAQKQVSIGVILGSVFGGLALLVGGAVLFGHYREADNADRVMRLEDIGASDSPDGHFSGTRAARTPDGSLWVACKHDMLCGMDEAGAWLGTVRLPLARQSEWNMTQRYGATRGMAGDRAGRLYVSYDSELLEISTTDRRIVRRVPALPEGEHPRCLFMAEDDSLFMMTSTDDVVQLNAARAVQARWPTPVLALDPRHHGCDTIAVDRQGQVWVTPEGAPAIYVFSPTGVLVRRHTPGGHGHYMGLAVLADGSAIAGYNDELLLFGADFSVREGPVTSRRPGWAGVAEVLRTPDDTLVVVTLLGVVARWDGISTRW